MKFQGHPVQCKTFSRRAAARDWAEKEQHRLRVLRPGQSARVTLGDAIRRYKREALPGLRSRAARESQLDWWAAELGDMAPVDLTPSMIAGKLEQLVSEPNSRWKGGARYRSGPIVNRYHAALSGVLRMAAKART